MSVTVHPSSEFSEMSNLSTTSIVTALEVLQKSFVVALQDFQDSIGLEMRTMWNKMHGVLEKSFTESARDREVLRDIVLSMKEMLTPNPQSSLLLAQKYNNPLTGHDILDGSASLDNTAEKSFFIEFGIQQPDGSFTRCSVLPFKDLMSIFGKGKKPSEPKSISSDPLKLLVACAFSTFLQGDRVILPILLEWKSNSSMSPADLKQSWLTECLRWFPNRDTYKGKYAAAGIVHNGMNPVFVVFSYDGERDIIKPSLTAFVSEKKAISDKFPWYALGELFMEVLCVRESVGGMEIEETAYQTVAFLDPKLQKLYKISEWFELEEKDFQINLPKEIWKSNDFSLAVHGVVVFSSKLLTGMYSVKGCNVFIDLAVKLQRAIDSSDVVNVRKAICGVLYLASLKLVNLNKAKLLTDEFGNDLNDDADAKGVVETLQVQVAQYFGMSDGKQKFGFEIICFHVFEIHILSFRFNHWRFEQKDRWSCRRIFEQQKESWNYRRISKQKKKSNDVTKLYGVSNSARKS